MIYIKRFLVVLFFFRLDLGRYDQAQERPARGGDLSRGDARGIRLAIGSEVRTIAVHEIAVIQFGSTAATAGGKPKPMRTDGSGSQQLCQAVLAFR